MLTLTFLRKTEYKGTGEGWQGRSMAHMVKEMFCQKIESHSKNWSSRQFGQQWCYIRPYKENLAINHSQNKHDIDTR